VLTKWTLMLLNKALHQMHLSNLQVLCPLNSLQSKCSNYFNSLANHPLRTIM
ncbi:hypothetical protein A2U01_0058807, partial [Trifolium medium]|nr:hypothetical protein [Trifolium medium]